MADEQNPQPAIPLDSSDAATGDSSTSQPAVSSTNSGSVEEETKDGKIVVDTGGEGTAEEISTNQQTEKTSSESEPTSSGLVGLTAALAPMGGDSTQVEQQLHTDGEGSDTAATSATLPDGTTIDLSTDIGTSVETEKPEQAATYSGELVSDSNEAVEGTGGNQATPQNEAQQEATPTQQTTPTQGGGVTQVSNTEESKRPEQQSPVETLKQRAQEEIEERAKKYIQDKGKEFYENRIRPGQAAKPGATPPSTATPAPTPTPPPVAGAAAAPGGAGAASAGAGATVSGAGGAAGATAASATATTAGTATAGTATAASTAGVGAAAGGAGAAAGGAAAAGAAGAAAGSVVPVVGTVVVGAAAYLGAKVLEDQKKKEALEKLGEEERQQAEEEEARAKEEAEKNRFAAVKNVAAKVGAEVLKKNPWVLAALAIILILGLLVLIFVMIFAWREASAPRGDVPESSFSMHSGVVDGTWANPESLYMTEMATEIRTEKGTPLAIGATSGGFSCEREAVVRNGQPFDATTGGVLAGERKYNNGGFTQAEIDYYITGRWPYNRFSFWRQSEQAQYSNNPRLYKTRNPAFERSQYWGRKAIIYSPENRRGVVGIIAEEGPATWTGIPKSKEESQRSLWQNGPLGNAPRTDVPIGYTGRIAGGPSAIARAIGYGSCNEAVDKPIIIGFLADQAKYPVGHVFDGPDVKKMEESLTPSTNANLSVVGISQGRPRQCGIASIAMVATYYFTEKGTVAPKYADLPEKLRAILLNQSTGGSTFTTNPDAFANQCVRPDFLNDLPLKRDGKDVDGWTRVSVRSAADFAWAVSSIKAGDPVIVYTQPGGAFTGSEHIYVLTGWDAVNREFVVNNPFHNGVQRGVRGSQLEVNKAQTFDHLYRFRGQDFQGYSGTMLIRSIYVKN